MDPRVAATPATDPHAIEFVRFCHRRRRVGWPELYDEMCAVAARGLYHGYSSDDLGNHGIRFGLFDMPALAALTREVVAAELATRRPVQVVLHELPAEPIAGLVEATPAVAATTIQVAIVSTTEDVNGVPVQTDLVATDRIATDRVADERRPASDVPVPRFRPIPVGA